VFEQELKEPSFLKSDLPRHFKNHNLGRVCRKPKHFKKKITHMGRRGGADERAPGEISRVKNVNNGVKPKTHPIKFG
jgi:hypothetical protein